MSESREEKSAPGGQRTPPAILIGRRMRGAASYKISAPPMRRPPEYSFPGFARRQHEQQP